MENNPSKKKFRGFKYMVLVLLIFAAFGLAWFSTGGSRSGEQQATMKEKASSLMADAKEQGKGLMDKAGDMSAGIGDTIAKGRDQVSSMASDVREKAGEMVQAASDAGSDLVERGQSTAVEAKEMIKDATSTIGSGKTEMEDTGPSADMSEQASSALGEGQSEVNTMMEDATESLVEGSDSVPTDNPSMSFKKDTSLSFNNTPSATMSDVSREETEKNGMDQPMSNLSSDMASSKVEAQGDEASVKKGATPGASAIRCIGPPPKGKDQGDHYIVAVCETLSIISERTGVGVEELKNRNPQVDNPNLIFPNQRLWLPPRG